MQTSLLTRPQLVLAVYPVLLNCKRFSRYCSRPTIHNWFAVYPALFLVFMVDFAFIILRKSMVSFFCDCPCPHDQPR